MIGDANVFITALARSFRHVLDGVNAVARDRMRVQVATNILARHQARQRRFLRSLHLVMAFAQFGLDVLKAKMAVKRPLRGKAPPLQIALRFGYSDLASSDVLLIRCMRPYKSPSLHG